MQLPRLVKRTFLKFGFMFLLLQSALAYAVDSDGDGVDDAMDSDPLNAYICSDIDLDSCDDCSVVGAQSTSNDGLDTDSDGLCDAGDPDDDGDGLSNDFEINYSGTDPNVADMVYTEDTLPEPGDMDSDGDVDLGDNVLHTRQILEP